MQELLFQLTKKYWLQFQNFGPRLHVWEVDPNIKNTLIFFES